MGKMKTPLFLFVDPKKNLISQSNVFLFAEILVLYGLDLDKLSFKALFSATNQAHYPLHHFSNELFFCAHFYFKLCCFLIAINVVLC